MWVAARCEPELRPAMVKVDAKFTSSVIERWARALPETTADPRPEAERSLVFAVCNGLALRRIFPAPHESDSGEVLSLLQAALRETSKDKP